VDDILAPLPEKKLPKPGSRIDPCIDKRALTYLNKRQVQVALHVIDSDRKKLKMETCSNYMVYDKKSQLTSMVPIHNKMLNTHLRILIYSGDVDAMVPVLSTRQWIEAMNMPIVHDWLPWEANTGQIGGYVVDYEHMTFATIRHAGHMVPYTQGERGLHIFRRFLEGRKF
jgi:serine carboxypeptidase-like clade 2